ncbi:MAG: 50S ribosomal protein L23 [Candidatus Paceibacterota bacterium]|jgi:large subunit ribosomal protein L23
MALNIFKKETQKGTGNDPVKEIESKQEKKAAVKKVTRGTKVVSKAPGVKGGYVLGMVKAPYITEKAVNMNEKDYYVFRVASKANKTEVKKAIEDIYKVNVEKITIVNTSDKKVGRGKKAGIQKGFKKALVKIKSGQRIEVMAK